MKPKLLVIDDEPAIQHAFARAYRDSEMVLTSAMTAAEAVEAFRATKPDVVVLDVHLPDASGLETYRRLRALDARVPVILITGHGTTDLAIQAISEGAFEYLLKPPDLPVLKDVIDRAFRASRLMREPAALSEVEPVSESGDALIGRGGGDVAVGDAARFECSPDGEDLCFDLGRIARLVAGEGVNDARFDRFFKNAVNPRMIFIDVGRKDKTDVVERFGIFLVEKDVVRTVAN